MMANLNLGNLKTIVITGSSGFIGEKLAVAAQNLGFNVIGIDLHKSSRLQCPQFAVDLNSESISTYVPAGASIVHLASLSSDNLCRENPILAIDTNLKATALVVEAAKKSGAAHLIFASSEWVYPEKTNTSEQFETDLLSLSHLDSLYAISKLMGEAMIRTTSSTPYSLLRFGIVYGPRSKPGSAAESIAFKVDNGDEVRVGSAKTARRFIYVDDLVQAILKVVEFGSVSDEEIPLNLAGSELVSLSMVVDTVNNILGKSVPIMDEGNAPSIRNPSIRRASTLIDWKPSTNFSIGIAKCLSAMSNSVCGEEEK